MMRNDFLHYAFAVFLSMIITSDESRTTLSKSNCPSKFYIEQANVTMVSPKQSISSQQSFYSLYATSSLQSSTTKIVIEGDSSKLSDYVLGEMWMYIVIGSAVFLFFVILAICSLFEESCPPSDIRRDVEKNPFSQTEVRSITFCTVLVSLGVLVVCLIPFSYIPSLKDNMEYTQCAIYIALDSTLNGEADTEWGGFINLYQKIGNVSQYLTASLPSMTTYLLGNEWLTEQVDVMQQMNLNIYKNNKDAVFSTPNPTTTQTALDNGLPIPTINSRFIVNGLGPNGTFGTMVDDIDRGLRITEQLSQQAFAIELSATRLIDSESTVLSNTASSQQTLEMYIEQLWSMTENIDLVKTKYFKGYFQQAIYFLQGVFGVLLIGAVLSLMGVVSVYCFQIFTCRSMVVVSWALYGVLFIGTLICVYLTLSIGALGYGFCNYFDLMLSEKQAYNKIIYSYSQNPFNRLDDCFFGDGNVLAKFDLEEEMSTVTDLFEHIQTYYDYEDALSTNYVDKTISTGKISNWLTTLNNYKRGIYIDYDETESTDDNPNYAILSLNLYTGQGGLGGTPTCSKDRWVFDATNCTNTTVEETYISGTAANGVALEPIVLEAICISFNQKFSTLQSKSWTQNDFTKRYTQIRSVCPDSYEKILEYGYSIINYRTDRENTFQGIYDELLELQTKNLLFNSNVSAFKSKVESFELQATALNNIVTNEVDGLLVSSDCRPIVDNVRFFYNMFCVNVMYDVVRLGWCSIIACSFLFLAMIFNWVWMGWFKEIELNSKNKFLFLNNYTSSQYQSDTIATDKGFDALGGMTVHSSTDIIQIGQGEVYSDKSSKNQKSRRKKYYGSRLTKKSPAKNNPADSSSSEEEENPYLK